MDIEYHETDRYHAGAGSLLETIPGGVTARCGEALASAKLLGASKANLAFFRCFLAYRAVFIKNTYGGMFLLAGMPEWKEDISTPLFDPNCHGITHYQLVAKPTTDWMDAWGNRVFSDKKVKVAVLSYGRQSLCRALMRDNDEFTVIAGEADESKLPAK